MNTSFEHQAIERPVNSDPIDLSHHFLKILVCQGSIALLKDAYDGLFGGRISFTDYFFLQNYCGFKIIIATLLRLINQVFMSRGFQKKMDVLGVSAAVLCLIHCLVFPLVFLIPLGSHHNHWIDLVFVLLGLYAVAKVTKNHRFHWISWLLWSGISLVAVSVLLSFWTHTHTPWMYVGVLLLITGHFLHFKKVH